MRLDTNTTYHMDFDSEAFSELANAPELYASHLFNVDVMNLDGSMYGGWYVCVLRRLGDRFVFIPLFDSMKESFLLNADPIETFFVSSFTMYDYTSDDIDANSDFVRAYKLPIATINSFNTRSKRKDGNLVVSVLCEGVSVELEFKPSLAVVYHSSL